MNNNMKFFDIETKGIVTISQLKEEYEKAKKEEPQEMQNISFTDFINNCLVKNDGTLVILKNN